MARKRAYIGQPGTSPTMLFQASGPVTITAGDTDGLNVTVAALEP